MQADLRSAPVVLIGLMGAGKSTVGPLVARRLSRPFVDVDAALEAQVGRSIVGIFAEDGEDAFRQLESQVLAQLLARPDRPVIGAGGGAVLAAANRELLTRAAAAVVWLQADPAVLAARVGEAGDRPVLARSSAGTSVVDTLARLAGERGPSYQAAATHRVAADIGLAEQVAEAVVRQLRGSATEPTGRVEVGLGARSYPVVVGAGALRGLADLLPVGTGKVAVVTQPGIGVDIELRVEHRTFLLNDGEAAKSLGTVEDLCRQWAQWGLSRADAVVAVGGGVVTDVAGFAAAVYHRGIPVVHVPTTLLGQIDAAIGGKTGVNLPEGKNLVGAFWQPAAVICDTDTLITLPARDYRSGLGELAKYHFLGGGALERLSLPERVLRSVQIKAAVVAGDEREGGDRATLNYGHTLAHALETTGRFDLRHGEAVAIGLVFAAHLAQQLGRIDGPRVEEHYRVVQAYGLGHTLPSPLNVDELIELMARDKKALRGLTFVLERPTEDGRGYQVELVAGVAPDDVGHAVRAMKERAIKEQATTERTRAT